MRYGIYYRNIRNKIVIPIYKAVDVEWIEAENADEKTEYYKVYNYNGYTYNIKEYKPSLAKLVAKRTGQRIELMSKHKVKVD